MQILYLQVIIFYVGGFKNSLGSGEGKNGRYAVSENTFFCLSLLTKLMWLFGG